MGIPVPSEVVSVADAEVERVGEDPPLGVGEFWRSSC